MKILIKELGKNGEIISENLFLTFKEAAAAIGVPSSNIYNILKRTNPIYITKNLKDGFFSFKKKETKIFV